jgi:oligogalacturonide transport system permease protein
MKRHLSRFVTYVLLCLFGFVMIYPLLWLFMATFKTDNELFSSVSFLPKSVSLQAYINGWKSGGQYTYGRYIANTLLLTIPTVFFTVTSSALVAYGFARFSFRFKKPLFTIMIATLMLPNTVIVIPRYLIFRNLGWLDSYLPFIVPAILACYPFFIFMMIQFMRGLPKDLDESAYIDGCTPFRTFVSVLMPLLKPALFSVAIFQFIWTWGDFFNALIYITTVKKYTLSLALRMSIDATGGVISWNQILAMSVVALLPPAILFFSAQRYFVEGVTMSGIKG